MHSYLFIKLETSQPSFTCTSLTNWNPKCEVDLKYVDFFKYFKFSSRSEFFIFWKNTQFFCDFLEKFNNTLDYNESLAFFLYNQTKRRSLKSSDYYWPMARGPSRLATGWAISTLTELRLVPLRLKFFYQYYVMDARMSC